MRGGVIDLSGQLTRIGVFYDGSYFYHVSNYYRYQHSRQARLSIRGLHNFIKDAVARKEGSDVHYCQIVDAHYFRGRLDTQDAVERDTILSDRKFDEILMREGIVTHYLPVRKRSDGTPRERGIDVWFSLEAFELAIYKRFNVIVLIAGDGDFLPLVRKLNTIGTRVMVLGWDIKEKLQDGKRHPGIGVAQTLLDEATYPIEMNGNVIEDRSRRSDPLISNLFLPSPEAREPGLTAREPGSVKKTGQIYSLIEETYGFITPDEGGDRLFFHRSDVEGKRDFSQLKNDDPVTFVEGTSEKGDCARCVEFDSARSHGGLETA